MVTTRAAVNTVADVPPRKANMTPAQLRKLLKDAGLGAATKSEVATVLGVARSHLYRWLKGADDKGTNITEANALLIRKKLAEYRRKK